MKTANVLFLPHNVKTTVDKGANLIRAAMEAGVHINASCGGDGVCGKCRVIVEEGKIDGGLTEKLSEEDIEKGYRQACLTSVQGDIVVRIPIESEVDASLLNLQKFPRRTAKIWEMDLEGVECLCTCPCCGLGVCLCAQGPRRTLSDAWVEVGPISDEAEVFVHPPRLGSAAATAGYDSRQNRSATQGWRSSARPSAPRPWPGRRRRSAPA